MKRVIVGIVLAAMLGCSGGSTTHSYENGRTDGVLDGREFARSYTDYTNEQIDKIVDPVVSERKEKIYSKGQAYGDGWVSGFKEGMRK